jgi:Flp pilus assembly protein TadD
MRHVLTAIGLATLSVGAMAMGGGGSSAPSASVPQYDAAAEYRKGQTAFSAGDFKAASAAFDKVVAVAPKDANAHYLGGVSRARMGDNKGAVRLLTRAVKLDRSMTSAWRELGIAQARAGDKGKAQATIANLQARATTCGTCAEATTLKGAIDAISAALNGTPAAALPSSLLLASNGDARYLEAVSLINEKRYDDAIASLNAARASFGPHPDILTYLGFANRKLKRFDVAEDFYQQALAAAPDHRGAKEYYGELMVERGDLSGAKAMLAALDAQCRFGCAEAEELRRWVSAGRSPHS